MPSPREELQHRLFVFEWEMRVISGTYITTERFLTQFLVRAEQIYRDAPAVEKAWVSNQISQILAKFGFK